MKYLYISTLSSERLINQIFEHTGSNPGYAIQKFSRLLVKGFIANKSDISTLSAIPVVSKSWKKRLWFIKSEIENGVKYKYIPFLNFPIFRQLGLFVYTFFYVLFWGMKDRKNSCIICDVLNISICISSLCAAKIIGLKRIGVVTDLPNLMMRGGGKRTIYRSFIDSINNSYLSNFTHYVLLTEPMNQIVNKHCRPYLIMEGLADIDLSTNDLTCVKKKEPKIVMYAGGLHERYGLKILTEAFMGLNNTDWNLVIYGSGPFSEDLIKYAAKDNRIIYKGVASNDEVVKAELKASLLVNPRPTHEEFTKYSFPSKNIEYMVSGTPLLTTKLPGMPIEYYSYVYLFDKESIEGYKIVLEEILNTTYKERLCKGQKARDFILKQKNNVVQARRIIDFMNNN